MTADADFLLAVDADELDSLFPLLDGPAVVAELTRRKPPHKSAVFRWAREGIGGVKLKTLCVGRTRYSTRRHLLAFFAAVDDARRAAAEPPPKTRRRTVRRR